MTSSHDYHFVLLVHFKAKKYTSNLHEKVVKSRFLKLQKIMNYCTKVVNQHQIM